MDERQCTDVAWFKSSYSGGSGTECVEAAFTRSGTSVRDSKDPDGPVLAFSREEWRHFLSAVCSAQLR
ncbi:DUF397 domain-containing protein [Streptomyces meridianus]|uniref:DUF397 domain-containing protein n=1 Tax=Streptomyces meridianus TaxID=2938945 RepID=A0ABT0X1S7_9ACTN|nr:DUF397 domain-containing protein [Streptomyces meridianus]MCM2575853.1 DUF397 domain-containing protein [Streptomyces meridianus]